MWQIWESYYEVTEIFVTCVVLLIIKKIIYIYIYIYIYICIIYIYSTSFVYIYSTSYIYIYIYIYVLYIYIQPLLSKGHAFESFKVHSLSAIRPENLRYRSKVAINCFVMSDQALKRVICTCAEAPGWCCFNPKNVLLATQNFDVNNSTTSRVIKFLSYKTHMNMIYQEK